jgi:thiol:disulfide interchange protein DsbA
MRIFSALLGLALSVAVPLASAAPAYSEGKDYTLLAEPVRTADANKIEVAEVFSYACPHCFHFEPLLQAWAKKQAADVILVQTHAAFNSSWVSYQRGFYTLMALGVKDKVQDAIFSAIHVGHKELKDAQAWADFLSLYGVEKQKTLSTYNSFGVNSQMKQADNRVRDLKVNSTPQLIINGRYKIIAEKHEDMLNVAQFLVDKLRSERAATKH